MRRALRLGIVTATAVGLAGCGGPTLPQAPSTSPFEAASVQVQQSGNAPVTVDTASVTFSLDDARTLVGKVTVTSTSSQTTAILVRVTLTSPSGAIVGDATGGQVNVPPNTPTTIPLTGPAPIGTIASANVEVSLPPPPTQTPGGAPTPVSQLAIPTPT